MAPKFHVISQPNAWAKAIKTELSDTKMLQLEFWNKFKEYATSHNTKLKLRKAHPQHWFSISYGTSGSHVELTLNTTVRNFGCEIYIPDSKDVYKHFHKNKQAIESELGEELKWMELPQKKASRIRLFRDGDITDKKSWKEHFEWLKTNAEKFQEVFYKYRMQ